MRRVILQIVAVMGLLAPAQGTPSRPEAKRAEVLVLGAYHKANPGRDVFNLQADDVPFSQAPRRGWSW